jgi:hypothetical protein
MHYARVPETRMRQNPRHYHVPPTTPPDDACKQIVMKNLAEISAARLCEIREVEGGDPSGDFSNSSVRPLEVTPASITFRNCSKSVIGPCFALLCFALLVTL